jgi:hypothetical protein
MYWRDKEIKGQRKGRGRKGRKEGGREKGRKEGNHCLVAYIKR